MLRQKSIRSIILVPVLLASVWLLMCSEASAQRSWFNWGWFRQPPRIVDRNTASNRGLDARSRLASVPEMFGDTFARGGNLTAADDPLQRLTTTSVLAGGTRGLKPAEYNKALPVDRFYFVYHHFHNAIQQTVDNTVGTLLDRNSDNVDQFVIGGEYRIDRCGCTSVEVRMPFAAGHRYEFTSGATDVGATGGTIGNLSFLLKRQVYNDCCTVVSLGLGVETPTGSDFFARTPNVSYRLANDSTHLLPFVAMMHTPDDWRFLHAFISVDVPLNGNRAFFTDGAGTTQAGVFTDQSLLYIDLGGGVWAYRNPMATGLTGIALISELHYTHTLENTDVITGTPFGGLASFSFANLANRQDVFNATAAIDFEFGGLTQLRLGAVAPLKSFDDRFFDVEFAAQLIRRY